MNNHELTNRIKKRFKLIKKWAKRENITCFRVYERDLDNYPMILDWYDGDAICWIYDRTRDETDEDKETFKETVIQAVLLGCDINKEHLFVKSRHKQKGEQYQKLDKQQITKVIAENGLKFEVNLSDYLDTGLFLDHRNTRKLCQDLSKGKRVLNLFAYTGSFTCYAIAGEALATTTVDLSGSYLKLAQKNMALNGFSDRKSDRFIVDNVLSFIKKEASRNRYDVIICDPPTFSNSNAMSASFSVNNDYVYLIKSCLKLLAPSGTLIFSTNSRRFKLDTDSFPESISINNISKKTIPHDFRNDRIHQCWLFETPSE